MEKENQNNNFSHSPLFSSPLEIFEMILRLVDAPSVISLWEAVHGEACQEIERTFNTYSGRWLWAHWCRKYYDDPMVMTVLASYDPLVETDTSSSFVVEDNCKSFMWFSVYQAAAGLPTIIKTSIPVIENLSKLTDQIKMEMSVSSKGRSSGQREDSLPHRQTGCNGMIAWNILYENEALFCSEQVTLFADLSICKRMIPIKVKKVHQVHFLNVPLEKEPSGDDIGILKVQRLMVIVSNSHVFIVPVHGGPEGFLLTLGHYSFEKASPEYKMEPIISIHKNYIAVWSNPYDLKIYAVSLSHRRVEAQLLVELNDSNISYLGNLWGKLSKYSPTMPYFFFFSLTPHVQKKSVTENGFDSAGDNYLNNGAARPIYKFDLMVCSPKDYKHQATVFNNIGVRETIFSFVKTEIKHDYDNIDESQVINALNDGHFSTSASHGLFLAYSEEILTLSKNGTQWFFKRWAKDNSPDKEHQHTMIKVEIVAPNLLAVVSKLTQDESLISMVEINFFTTTSAEDSIREEGSGSEEEEGGACKTGAEKLTLILQKQIKADFLMDKCIISQLGFSYDKGVPYLWMEVQKSEEKLDDDDDDKKILSDLQFEIFRVKFLPESEKQE